MSDPTPDDLADLKTAAWRAIRRSNETGGLLDLDAADYAMKAVDEAAERYRLAHYPNALRIFVLADADLNQPVSIWAVYPTGPECVFEAHAERVA